jgi:uncharacterized phage-associated protein
MNSAHDIAKYVIAFFQKCEDPITNLKLQKILYYIQGWYLGLYEIPAFEEPLQAWVHGPVQPGVYQAYKHYRWDPISEEIVAPDLPDKMKAHIQDVLDEYGVETAYWLERATHQEEPWIKARNGIPLDQDCKNEITKESMKNYFKRLANEKD